MKKKSCTYLNTELIKVLCALRLSVRTPDFHSGKRGSIPLGRTIVYPLKSMTYKRKIPVLET